MRHVLTQCGRCFSSVAGAFLVWQVLFQCSRSSPNTASANPLRRVLTKWGR